MYVCMYVCMYVSLFLGTVPHCGDYMQRECCAGYNRDNICAKYLNIQRDHLLLAARQLRKLFFKATHKT